jgi:hypothetical protein
VAVTYTAVQADVADLRNGVAFIENELKNYAGDPKPGDNFKSVMTISAAAHMRFLSLTPAPAPPSLVPQPAHGDVATRWRVRHLQRSGRP